MKLKKIFASALVAVAAVTSVASLSSCSGDKPTTNTPPVDNNDAAAEIQAKLQKAIDGLSLKASYDADFTLSTTAAGGVTISWASDNKDVISFDNGKATVKRPGIGQADVTVKITATAVIDGETKSKDFTVTVPAVEDNAKTIAAIKQLQIGDAVAAKGVVTGFVYAQDDINVRSGFYLTDATGTIYVFGMNTAAEVEEGDEIYFTGTYDCYFGSPQIKNPNDLVELGTSKSADYSAAIKDKTVTDIVTSEVPSGEQATTPTTIHGNVYDMVVYFEKVATDTYVNYRVCDPNNLDNYANIYFRSTIVPGTNYSFTEEFDTYANSYCRVKFVVNGTSSKGKWRGHVLEFSKLTDAEKLQVELMKAASDIPASAFVPADGLEYAIPAITLPEGYTLNVTSDKTCVTYADSKIKITRPEESTTAKITLAIKNGETVVAEHSVSIDLAVGAVDITSAVTINNGYITIPYNAITGDGKYVINVATDKKIYIEWNGFQDKASYKEIGISGGSAIKVTTEGIKLDALISDVYGSYDNMKCYVGTDNTTTPITATKGTGTGTTYTYLFANDAEAVYFLNDSTYSVAFYGLQLVTEGSYVEPEEPETPTEEIEDGIVSILPSAFPAAYPESTETLAAGNFTWEFANAANYGSGIQMKKQEGTIYNLVALTGKITKIELVWNADKSVYDNNNALKIQLGTDTTYAGNTVYISTVANQKSYSLDITGEYTFIKLTNNINYAQYWDSIKVYYDGDAPEDVLEPEVNYAEVAEEEAKKLAALIGANYDEETTIDLTSTVGTVAVTPQTGATTLAFADNKLTVTPQANEVTETLTITVTVEGASYTTEAISVKTKLYVPVVGTYSATAQYTAGVTDKMVVDANNAKTFGLKEVLFNVTTDEIVNTDYTNPIGLNKDGSIRLYSNLNEGQVGDGNEFTIAAQSIEGLTLTINKITVTFGDGKNTPTFTVNGEAGSTATAEYVINGSSVVIKNTTTESAQLWITKIVIDYTIVEASTTPENPEPEEPETEIVAIEEDTTYSFNSADTTVKDNYYVLTSGLQVQNSTATFENLLIDASTGKLADNSGTWFQFNNTTSIKFKVAKAAIITLKMHNDVTTYTVNGAQADATHTYNVEAGEVIIASTADNTYIGYIYVTFPVELEEIEEDTTYSFNSADTTVKDNYYVLTSGLQVQNSTATFENLLIDASTGKLADNSGTWFQFNNTTSIKFKVAKAAVITLKMHNDVTTYTVNGAQADATHTYNVEAGEVVIASTADNTYIGYIYVSFPEPVTDITNTVTIENGIVSIPYGAITADGKYAITVGQDQVIYIEWAGFVDISKYSEFGVSAGNAIKISTEGIKLDALISDVYGNYNNMKCYVGADNTGTKITPTTGKGSGIEYTYVLDSAEAIYFVNDSTYEVDFFDLQLVVEGSYEAPAVVEATIAEANTIGANAYAKNGSTTQKYKTTGVITEIKSTSYGNLYISDGENTIYVYGLYDAQGNRYDAMESKPAVGDTIVIEGSLTQYSGAAQFKSATLVSCTTDADAYDRVKVLSETNRILALFKESYSEVTTIEITSTLTTVTVIPQENATTLAFADGVLTITPTENEVTETVSISISSGSAVMPKTVSIKSKLPAEGTEVALAATFTLGTDDATKTDEGTQDGSSFTEYTETSGNYTLSLTSGTKTYSGSYDAKGNACIKLGTSSVAGSFTFEVASDVQKVVIYVAGYKSNAAKISINGGETQTISTKSSAGEYTAITIDTSTTKTITFTTVSGGYRCKISTIEFYA